MAYLEIAYETSVSSGYRGSLEEWVSSKLIAHVDSNGDIVVLLPDGGEFAVLGGNRSDSADVGVDALDEDGVSGSSTQQTGGEATASEIGSWPVMSVDVVRAQAGSRDVVVPVRISSNPGILGMSLSVSYDESALTLRSAENGEAFRDVLTLTHSKSLGTGCLFAWDGVEVSERDVRDGVVLNLCFDISDDAGAGAYPIVIRESGPTFDNELNEVGISMQDGHVIVG